MNIPLDVFAEVDISLNPNTLNFWTAEYEYIKKLEYKYIYESIYSLESEYISFFAIEYEYNYPVRDMDLGPRCSHIFMNQNFNTCKYLYIFRVR